ncbi:hypothetical protein GCM10025868_17500 [Angustibacter aerolatus]|uniref:Uncharacterized protein n=1 Tax=Angustibacter aerolatus TaxID=1162965 RepID=A0ABQ6JI51_9ACTN|nr:hypothetical protein GCM10025868_17500 [Angustibacter aerolatus]
MVDPRGRPVHSMTWWSTSLRDGATADVADDPHGDDRRSAPRESQPQHEGGPRTRLEHGAGQHPP